MNLPARALGWAAFAAVGPLLLWIVPYLPFLTSSHLVFIANLALATIGLTLIMGFARQISLGHAAFYGIGAYSTAILTVEYGWHPIAAITAGLVLAGVVGALLAVLVFRATEHFLAMATLAFGLIFYFSLQYARGLTGGNAGRGGIDKIGVGAWALTTNDSMFLFTWLLVVAGVVLARNIVRSRTGRALRAVGASPVAAACCGINTTRAKVGVFAVGGLYAALAGSLYAHHVTYVSPDEFGLLQSIQFLIIAIVGGLGSVWGAPVGAVVLIPLTELGRGLVPRFVEGATGPYELMIYGLILVLVLVFLPRGVAGTVGGAWRRRTLARTRSPGRREPSRGAVGDQ